MNHFAVQLKLCKSTILQLEACNGERITECYILGRFFPLKIMTLGFTHLTKHWFVNFTNLWYSILQACHNLFI